MRAAVWKIRSQCGNLDQLWFDFDITNLVLLLRRCFISATSWQLFALILDFLLSLDARNELP